MTARSTRAARAATLLGMGLCIGAVFGLLCEHLLLWTATGAVMGLIASVRTPEAEIAMGSTVVARHST